MNKRRQEVSHRKYSRLALVLGSLARRKTHYPLRNAALPSLKASFPKRNLPRKRKKKKKKRRNKKRSKKRRKRNLWKIMAMTLKR